MRKIKRKKKVKTKIERETKYITMDFGPNPTVSKNKKLSPKHFIKLLAHEIGSNYDNTKEFYYAFIRTALKMLEAGYEFSLPNLVHFYIDTREESIRRTNVVHPTEQNHANPVYIKCPKRAIARASISAYTKFMMRDILDPDAYLHRDYGEQVYNPIFYE